MSDAAQRRNLVVLVVSAAAVVGIVGWVALSGGQSAQDLQPPVNHHVNQLEQAAEAADKTSGNGR